MDAAWSAPGKGARTALTRNAVLEALFRRVWHRGAVDGARRAPVVCMMRSNLALESTSGPDDARLLQIYTPKNSEIVNLYRFAAGNIRSLLFFGFLSSMPCVGCRYQCHSLISFFLFLSKKRYYSTLNCTCILHHIMHSHHYPCIKPPLRCRSRDDAIL